MKIGCEIDVENLRYLIPKIQRQQVGQNLWQVVVALSM
jgi:hypothetical protein